MELKQIPEEIHSSIDERPEVSGIISTINSFTNLHDLRTYWRTKFVNQSAEYKLTEREVDLIAQHYRVKLESLGGKFTGMVAVSVSGEIDQPAVKPPPSPGNRNYSGAGGFLEHSLPDDK